MSAETIPQRYGTILRAGVDRARIETRVMRRSRAQMLFQLLFWPALVAVTAGGATQKIQGTNVSLAPFIAAGFLGAFLVQTGILRLAQGIADDRQDGTFLRARSIGGGIESYFLGRVLFSLGLSLFIAALMILAGHVAANVALPSDFFHWFTLLWVIILGLFACLSVGAAIGGLLPNGKGATMLVIIPYVALIFISGVTTPASGYPSVVKIIGGIFPMRWMGQGLRSALLPDAAQTAEIGHQWDRIAVFLVLLAWCAAGTLLALYVLRRATLRESGSALEARQRAARGD